MTFLYPEFLFALTTLAIPIIIHLFNFRKAKTIYFSNVAFLKNVKQETKSKSQLKHLLILLARLLTIAALVLAFAQPFIPLGEQNKKRTNITGIYLDNSFSAEAESKNGKSLEVQKNKVLSVADAFPANQKFLFLSNEFSSKHRHLVSKEQLKENTAEVDFAPETRNLSQVIERLKNFFEKEQSEKVNLFLISDFQKSISDFENFKNDSMFWVTLIPVTPETHNNLYIDSVWFEKPNRQLNQPDELFIKIENRSAESYTNIPLKLYLNDTLKVPASFNIEAHSSTTEKVTFINNNTGIIHGRAEIADYPITYDNTFYFNFFAAKSRSIIVISSATPNKYISTLFAQDKYFKVSNMTEKSVVISDFNSADVIILDSPLETSSGLRQRLTTFVQEGGTLLVFPPLSGNHASYNELFSALGINQITGIDSTKVLLEKINYQADLFQNVFKIKDVNAAFPVATKYLKMSNFTQVSEETILASEKNDKYISRFKLGRGQVYLFAQEANDKSGDLVFHPLWAPLLYNMALFGNQQREIYHTIGKTSKIEVYSGKLLRDKVLHITDRAGKTDFIPRVSMGNDGKTLVYAGENISTAGSYEISNDNKKLQGISFNYNRKESEIEFYSVSEITDLLAKNKLVNFRVLDKEKDQLTDSIKHAATGFPLWKYFIWITLVFLALEVAFVRLLK